MELRKFSNTVRQLVVQKASCIHGDASLIKKESKIEVERVLQITSIAIRAGRSNTHKSHLMSTNDKIESSKRAKEVISSR